MLAIIEQPISLIEWNLINNLNDLPENKDIIIDFLLERLQHGQIYTWVDSLLLTLNPNNEALTSHLYHSSKLTSKFDKQITTTYETSPHIFTIAAKAHYNLTKKFGQNSQVIIISGESGTGKTFNVYKCLEFFSNINKASVQGDYTNNVMLRITDACHLISVFTTACTEKNEISSRHGELIKLHYKNNIISGATINSFLLERSRVTRGSDNFQIFYQMIFGISETELEDFYLSKDKDYDILSSIDYEKKKYFQNGFQNTLNALDMLDFKPDQKKHIFQVLALLIHMGNIKFIKNNEICIIDFNNNKSKEALKNSCILGSLTEDTMIKLLTTILINPQSIWRKHTSYHRYLVTVDACRDRLHSIIRHIYDLLFHWILNHTNNILSLKQQYSQWLGILDIFGFESFNKNGMEQLCVNYVNEKMQQYFIESYVKNNRNDLQEENFIEIYNPLHTINLYKERLNIIEKNLFLTLNDACQSFIVIDTLKIIQLVYKNLHNIQKKILSEKEGNFIIKHYSGPVAYSIKDILSKNTDKVPNEISLIFSTSKNKFLQSLINIEERQYLHIVKSTTKKKTMLAKLKYNMDVLIKELSKCDLHYVRCVKPNRLINHEWDRKDFQKQLACIGIFDALSLAKKCKYPIHFSYRDFYFRYSKKSTEAINFNKCKLIMESVISKKDLQTQVHFGKQLIFLTQHIFFILESYKRNYHIKCVNKIQEFWIRHKYKITLPILKYLTNNYQVQNISEINKNVISVKIILDHELKKLNTFEKNNNIFFTSLIFFKNNDEISYSNFVIRNTKDDKNINMYKNLKTHSQKENKNDSIKILNTLEKVYVLKNSQTNLKNLNYQFNPIYIKNFIKNDTSKYMRKINTNNFLKVKYNKNTYKHSDIMNTCNNNNNNLLKQYLGLHISLIHIDSTKKNYEKESSIDHKTENTNLIQMDSYPLFYKNGILSRQRLAAIPIRMHIRTTCLINSHILPRDKLPQGLQDCL